MLILFFLRLTITCALDITGQIVWNDVCPSRYFYPRVSTETDVTTRADATTLGQAKASIDDGVFTGSITRSGKFVM